MKTKHPFKKKVRQITSSAIGVTFTKQEQELYNIHLDDHLDLSDIIILSDQLNRLKEE